MTGHRADRQVWREGHRPPASQCGDVRHRGKIEAAIANAAATQALKREGSSLTDLLWRFAPAPCGGKPPARPEQLPSATAESRELAEELRRRGFRFVGPTTAYALMQAAGLVNDHLAGCAFR